MHFNWASISQVECNFNNFLVLRAYLCALLSLQQSYKIQDNRDNWSHFRDSKTEAPNSVLPCPKIEIQTLD